MIITSMQDATEGRRRTHEKIDALGQEVHSLRNGLKDLSDRVTEIEPTWKDYLRKQDQVRGAGTVGRAIWKAGGWLLAAAVAIVSFYAWMTSHITFRP
ncbi:MAG: hypothetical protein ACTHJQ_09505 [Rhizobiaceae bacterium]